MSKDERHLPGPHHPPAPQPPAGEPGIRPISASLRRQAVFLTPPQSDALARLLIAGERRLVEMFALRNGTLGATFRGAGYAARRVFITPDGRVDENEEASEPDPLGETTAPFILAREESRLHLGTLLSPHAERGDLERRTARSDQPTSGGESDARAPDR